MKKARYEEKLNEVRSCGQFSTIENCTETAVPKMRKELFAKSSKIHIDLTVVIKEINFYVFADFVPVCVLEGRSRILISGNSD